MMAICGAAALFAAGMLIFILADVFLKGVASLKLHFILFSEINTGLGLGTGIANAIAGTFLLAVTSTIIAIPFGVGTAIYLQKYASDNQITRFFRLMIEVLSGTPSIVLGIFGAAVLVIYLKPFTGGESLLAGSIALATLILPVIERGTEDALMRVPAELEEGSYALGATKWLTIRNITIPSAFSGIIIGAILGFGRAAEESAVVLLTAGYSQYLPEFRIVLNPQFLLGVRIDPLNNLVGSLPVFIYTSYENSNVFPVSSIFAAGFVLIVIGTVHQPLGKGNPFLCHSKDTGPSGQQPGFTLRIGFRPVPQEKTRGYGLMFRYGDCPFCIGGFDFPAGRDPYIRNTGRSCTGSTKCRCNPGCHSCCRPQKTTPAGEKDPVRPVPASCDTFTRSARGFACRHMATA